MIRHRISLSLVARLAKRFIVNVRTLLVVPAFSAELGFFITVRGRVRRSKNVSAAFLHGGLQRNLLLQMVEAFKIPTL